MGINTTLTCIPGRLVRIINIVDPLTACHANGDALSGARRSRPSRCLAGKNFTFISRAKHREKRGGHMPFLPLVSARGVSLAIHCRRDSPLPVFPFLLWFYKHFVLISRRLRPAIVRSLKRKYAQVLNESGRKRQRARITRRRKQDCRFCVAFRYRRDGFEAMSCTPVTKLRLPGHHFPSEG